MIVLAILAAASAWLVTRKAPQHRPLAWALTVCAGLDAVRLLGLPARVDMAVCLGAPAMSLYAYPVVLRAPLPTWTQRSASEMAAALWGAGSLWLCVHPSSWSWILPVAYGVVLVFGIFPALARVADGDAWTISQHVALILLAGDALAVASLCAREWISNQAGVVLVVVTVYQMVWWWRWRRWERN